MRLVLLGLAFAAVTLHAADFFKPGNVYEGIFYVIDKGGAFDSELPATLRVDPTGLGLLEHAGGSRLVTPAITRQLGDVLDTVVQNEGSVGANLGKEGGYFLGRVHLASRHVALVLNSKDPSLAPELKIPVETTAPDGQWIKEYVPFQNVSAPTPLKVLENDFSVRQTVVKLGTRLTPVAIVNAPHGLSGNLLVILHRDTLPANVNNTDRDVDLFTVPAASIRFLGNKDMFEFAVLANEQVEMTPKEKLRLTSDFRFGSLTNAAVPEKVKWNYTICAEKNFETLGFQVCPGVCPKASPSAAPTPSPSTNPTPFPLPAPTP